MKRIVSVSLGTSQRDYRIATVVLGQEVELRRIGTNGDVARAAELVHTYDGQIAAFAIDEPPARLHVGTARYLQRDALALVLAARQTPVYDGSTLGTILQRWAIKRVAERLPDVFRDQRVLFLNGLEHYQMARAIAEAEHGTEGATLCFADALVHSGSSAAPTFATLRQFEKYAAVAAPLLAGRSAASGQRVPAPRLRARLARLLQWADVVVASAATLRHYAPDDLNGCTIVTTDPSALEIAQLQAAGAATLVALTPPLHEQQPFVSTAVLEAIAHLVRERSGPADEAHLLDVILRAGWEPTIQQLNPTRQRPVFAFVVHPLRTQQIYRGPKVLRFARYLPQRLVEWGAAFAPPLVLSRIRGIRSAATGQEVQGVMLTLGSTPREMLRRPPQATYRQLAQVARMAQRAGARILGLGAFTSVVGDAGLTVARMSPIGITTGNTLTVAATLETARVALAAMGRRLEDARVMILGATGSIGAICTRMLALEATCTVAVAPRPERLLTLKQSIERDTPQGRLVVTTRADDYLDQVDLVIVATSALNEHLIDMQRLKPGAVICDVARPSNISEADAALRPDVLVIESGEIMLPGELELSVDIDLPPGTVYACLAETALLAMEGRFEHYTLGRTIEAERVREIHQLMQKHGLKLGALRSFGRYLSAEALAEKRRLAQHAWGRQAEERDAVPIC